MEKENNKKKKAGGGRGVLKHAPRYFKNLESGKEKKCQNWELCTNPIPFPELHSAAPAQPLSFHTEYYFNGEGINLARSWEKGLCAHMSDLSPCQGKHGNTNKEVF